MGKACAVTGFINDRIVRRRLKATVLVVEDYAPSLVILGEH